MSWYDFDILTDNGGGKVVFALQLLWIVLVESMGTISWDSAGFIIVGALEWRLASYYAAGILFFPVYLRMYEMHT